MAKRVYFGFDYEDVSDFRANVVRKHNFTGGVEKAGYLDASIWEEAKKKDPTALKRLINAELENTSTTAILIGSGTWERRWVRYEIMKSIERGNRVIGVHINSIRGKDQATKALGPNPFDFLGLRISADGKRATPTVGKNGQWIDYDDLSSFTVAERPIAERGKTFRLSHWLRTHDWVADDGFNNFTSWIS
jgi:hypothetical protein